MAMSDIVALCDKVEVKINGITYYLPFIKKDGTKYFDDFDTSEWARNYSFIAPTSFYASPLDAKDMHYTLFKIALFNACNPGYEITSFSELFRNTSLTISLTNYAFKGLEDVTNMNWAFAQNKMNN